MKKLLTMLFLMAFAWTSYAQLSTESFDGVTFPPTGWTTTAAASGLSFARVTAGTYPTTTPHSGLGFVKINSFSYSTGTALLISPALNLTTNPTYSVSFWMYRDAAYTTSADKIDVMVNTTASVTGAATIGTVNRAMNLAPVVATAGWYQYTFTIPGTFTGASNYVILAGTTAYGNNMYIDDVALPFAAPGVASVVAPTNGATGILNTTTLTWNAPTGNSPVYGYKLYMGTNNPPTNLVNGTDLGNVLTYTPSPVLTFNTTYYWKVVPYNGAGNAAAAPVWSFTTLAGFGTLQGYVLNCYGVPVSGATVAAQGPATYTTTSAADGKYQFINIPAASYTLGAQKVGFNTVTIPNVLVAASSVTDKNITLTQPGMTVLPNPNNVSINPNEYFNGAFTVTNPGCGILTWTATLGGWSSANHTWFSMPTLTGTVAPSTNVSVPALFNATGLAVGTLLSVNVTFTPSPAIGPALVVPVTMVVAGTALVPVTNLAGTLTNQLTGAASLTWDCTPGAGFLYYSVKRTPGVTSIVPSATTFSDILPTYGVYTYEVSAWYSDGQSVPAVVTVEWPNPTMTWTPAALAATVWANHSKLVDLAIGNTGNGTLAFEFPAYVDNAVASPLAYCTAGSTTLDEFISHVTLNTISNGSAYGTGGYSNYTAITTDLLKGTSYPVTVAVGPPSYTGDITGVWIDYDHNSTFDASEFTALTGAASATGTIAVPTSALSGPTTMRVRLQYNGTLSPCGSTTYGEVEDYTVNVVSPTFITAVAPASGFVAAAAAPQPVKVTFSATGDYAIAGVYVKPLVLTSNDLAHASVSITSTMTVTVPGHIAGVVTDGVTGNVLPGVSVSAGLFSATTNDDGAYTMDVDAGTYSVVFSRIGYQTVTVNGAVVTANNTTTVNAQMFETPYSPSCAAATVNATDTQADVTWCVPNGPYELLYDDGSAENFAAWQIAGNMNAVKFTPRGYPATVVGAKVFVGDGSFPAGGVITGAAFDVAVYDVDASGKPGTMLSTVPATVTNYGWVNVTGLNAVIASGDFFIVMIQGSLSPNCAPIGVDESAPKAYKSYSRNVGTSSPWGLSPYQDFMMHAVVSSPLSGDDAPVAAVKAIPVKVAGMISQNRPNAVGGLTGMSASVTAPEGYDNTDAVSKYSLSRIFTGAVTPVLPAAGTFTLINNALTATSYTDGGTTWSGLAQGWYAYGVKAVYPNGNESPFVYTGVVPHKMFADITINVKLVCGTPFPPAVGATVTLVGQDYPHDNLTAIVPASGTVFFDNVIKGKYDLTITKAGYTVYTLALNITGNKTIDAILEDIRFVPRNLFVDDMTLHATWDEPLAYAVQENFEGGTFPPAGWQATTQGSVGWYASAAGSSSGFAIPNHTIYAVTNDDAGGSANTGCCDYLITPAMDLTNAPAYALNFASFYDGTYGEMAYVEMSTDNGTTWTPIYTLTAAASWQNLSVDLSAYSGAAGLASVKFAFHADDAAQWASGWAIDDVEISSGGVPLQGYGVFLDATEVGQTAVTVRQWDYDPTTINYGQTYVAGVAGLYCSGFSDLDTYTFTSHFLYPPKNLVAVKNVSTTSGAAILTWDAPSTGDSKIDASYPVATTTGVAVETSAIASSFVPTSTGATHQTDANVLYDNGTIVSSTGTGPGGADESVIPAGGSSYGFGLNQAGGLSVADDFVVPATWTVTSVNFMGYQTNSGNTSTFTGAYFRIYDGDPSAGGTVVWGDLTTNHMTTTDWAHIYRENALGEGTARPVMNITCNGLNIVLAPGTYWIEWALTGSGSSGPWVPDVVGVGNAIQNTGTWAALVNPGPAGLPFTLSGTGGGSTNAALVGYHIFRNDASLIQVPATPLTYWDLNLLPATYCYDITAVYDLTTYGFPGTFGESSKEGTACVDVNYGFDLPFTENWTTGQFDVNLWTVGQNWVMDGQAGNALPSAKFKWDPLMTSYSSSLESFYMNASTVTTTTPYKIWLDYDLKLDDRTASTKELLTIEVWNGVSWKNVKEYANNGDFDWTAQHIDISTAAKHNVFKVRFRANGDLTGDIFSWAVDNIHIYVGYVFNPPLNLVATAEGTPKNDIKLTWGAPAGGGTVMSYILDDNTSEGGVYLNGAGEAWLGNEFAVADAGVLQSAAVYMTSAGGSAVYSVDVFNEAQVLVGSSAAFTPTFDDWTTVALPDVPFAGTFYVMVHMVVSTQSDNIAYDTDGPNAASNPEWVYDASGWTKLTDYGFSPCVDFVRATGLVGGKKTAVTFNAGATEGNYVSPLGASLAKHTFTANTGTEVAHVTAVGGDNSEAMLGYNVYRRAYAVFPAGQNTAAAGTWTKINPAVVVPTEYLDMNLSNLVTNCYEYQVKSVYDEGESDPTNIDWECIFVGLNPSTANEVTVYPNPATSYVRIDLTKEVNSISVYNSLGSVVVTKNVKGETTITLNTANYASGAYSVKFTTTSGDTFSRKFVVTK